VVKIIEKSGLEINWDIQPAGKDVIEKEGTPLPQRVLESIRKNKTKLNSKIKKNMIQNFELSNSKILFFNLFNLFLLSSTIKIFIII
jgi:isocitrate dehydrogenase (NAD+)